MTNYINSITVEGTSYPIGPLKLDDYDNIVSHNINLQSQQRSNVIIGNSSFELDPSTTTFRNNIIIGRPSLDTITNNSNNVIIGNGSNLVCITSESLNCKFNGVGLDISRGHIGVGPLSVGVHYISTEHNYITLSGPTNIYAIGSCVIPSYSGDVLGFAHVSFSYSATQDNPCIKIFSVSGDTIGYSDAMEYRTGVGDIYQNVPIVGFCVVSSERTSRLYFGVCSQYSVYSNLDLTVYTYAWPAPI